MDDQCAICNYIQTAIDNLLCIADTIEWSCADQKRKKDFGLDKSFVLKEAAVVQQMLKYHQYFHANGEALSDFNSVVNLDDEKPKPKRFRESK